MFYTWLGREERHAKPLGHLEPYFNASFHRNQSDLPSGGQEISVTLNLLSWVCSIGLHVPHHRKNLAAAIRTKTGHFTARRALNVSSARRCLLPRCATSLSLGMIAKARSRAFDVRTFCFNATNFSKSCRCTAHSAVVGRAARSAVG